MYRNGRNAHDSFNCAAMPPPISANEFQLINQFNIGPQEDSGEGRKNADCRRKKNGLRAEYKKGSENKGMECGLGE